MEALYQNYPKRWRCWLLAVAGALCFAMPNAGLVAPGPGLVVYAVAWLLVMLIGVSTLARPSWPWALQQDRADYDAVGQQRRLVDALYEAGVFDKNTTPDNAGVFAEGDGRFTLWTKQAGKTDKQIREALERSMFAFFAVAVDVSMVGPGEYSVAYRKVSDLDTLAALPVPYSALLEEVCDEY